MRDYKSGEGWEIFIGDCRNSMMLGMADASVQMCVTSPPYFGLRDYKCDGQLGREETPEAYIAAMVEVFREVKRVLKDDGVLWLNIGDSYAGSRGNYGGHNRGKGNSQREISTGSIENNTDHKLPSDLRPPTSKLSGDLKNKDLIGIPCILAGSRPGDTVLDPFGGSGTTAQVALQHGRKVILCELNGDYAPLIEQRIAGATSCK
jgi:DNA modification methylase